MSRDYTCEVPWLCSYIDDAKETPDRMEDYVYDALSELDDLKDWIDEIEGLENIEDVDIREGINIICQVKDELEEVKREKMDNDSNLEFIRDSICKLRDLAEEAFEMYSESQGEKAELKEEMEDLHEDNKVLARRVRELEAILDPRKGEMLMLPFYNRTGAVSWS